MCAEERVIDDFSMDKSTRDGYRNRCKRCEKIVRDKKQNRTGKLNITTMSQANEWLAEHHPKYKILRWAKTGKEKSLFLDTERNIEFEYAFSRFRDKITQYPNRTFGATKKEISTKVQATNLEKYGVKHALQREEIKAKAEKTTMERYGVKNIMHDKRFIRDNLCRDIEGKTISEWAEELGVSYSHFCNIMNHYGLDVAKGLKKNITSLEASIITILEELGVNFIHNEWHKDLLKRPDFVIPEHNLIIEANGLRWHSEEFIKGRNFHMKRRIHFENGGFCPLFFLGNEIENQRDIIKSIIQNKIGSLPKIGARKCNVLPISPMEAKIFLEKNHLMGAGAGRPYVLIHDDEIVAAMQVKNKSDGIEISRFCTKNGLSVPGGFSRLLKAAIKSENPKFVMTFIDRRYGIGNYLENLGFEKAGEHPSFGWTDCKNVFHRMKFNNKIAEKNGLHKIWDCGQAKYVLSL